MKLRIDIADTRQDVLRCQYLIAEVYNKEYGVVFSDDHYDLEAKVEPWPHRYAMGLIEGELVATIGLYLRNTYVERFGGTNDAELDAMVAAAGAADRYAASHKRELTKNTIARAWRGRGLNRVFAPATLTRDFFQMDTERPALFVGCARRSIWQNVWDKAGCNTRVIRPFPLYKIHEKYRSESDPMDSRLMIPDLDFPKRWYDLRLPAEVEV